MCIDWIYESHYEIQWQPYFRNSTLLNNLRISFSNLRKHALAELSEDEVETQLNDPKQDWSRVNRDPDFLLMNTDEKVGILSSVFS